jgi:ubiquinone/menaquinone biosynthesis C-methylase UbiE
VVLALRARGFDCYGLDYADKIIGILNKKFPEVPFSCGDIRMLPYYEESFDAYISLGLIEHFVNGQDQILQVAARVVKSGGYIFLQVPYLNPFRKLKIKLGISSIKVQILNQMFHILNHVFHLKNFKIY